MTPKRARWIKWTALGCGGAILLVVGFVAALSFGLFGVMKATAEPKEAVDGFLDAAARGDYAAAHDHFSVPLKETQPLEEFIAAAEANPSLFRIVDTSFISRSRDTRGAKLEGTAKLEAGSEVPVSFRLIKENDAWKLIAYNIGS